MIAWNAEDAGYTDRTRHHRIVPLKQGTGRMLYMLVVSDDEGGERALRGYDTPEEAERMWAVMERFT